MLIQHTSSIYNLFYARLFSRRSLTRSIFELMKYWKKAFFDWILIFARRDLLLREARSKKHDFFEWAETRALFEAKAWRMIKFLWENVICRHDYFEKLTINDDSENKKVLEKLVKRYRIKKMITLDYHFQINEMIEKNHKFLFDALFKMFNEELKSWMNNLHVVFWTDRFIVKFITDLTSFYLQCDNESMLSIELKILIWRILLWQKIHIIEDLLTMRTRQLQKKKWKHERSQKFIKTNAKAR